MRILLSLFILSIAIGCSSSEEEMKLTGNIKGLKQGTVLLQKIEDSTLVSLDSIEVKGDPNFEFTEVVESPEIYYLYLRLENGTLLDERIPFFAEPGEVMINTSLKKFGNEYKIAGSKNQDKFEDYKKLIQRFRDRNLDFIEQDLKARQQGDDSLINAIARKRNANISTQYLATVNFAINHKDYEVAPFLALTEIYDANLKYLDTVYSSLSPQVRESKYGSLLETYIEERQAMEDTIGR